MATEACTRRDLDARCVKASHPLALLLPVSHPLPFGGGW